MLTKTTVDAVFTKLAADEGKWYDGVKNWATADNYSNLKNVGMGVGTAAATYGLTGLLPNAKKNRLARLAASVAAGGAAGYYGKDIRNFDYGKLNPWRGNTANRAQAKADRDIEMLKGKTSYGEFKNLIASAKATRPGPTLQNAARLEASRTRAQADRDLETIKDKISFYENVKRVQAQAGRRGR